MDRVRVHRLQGGNQVRKTGALALVGSLVAALAAAAALASTSTGPSSSQGPYLVPSQDGVSITSIVTVGDSVPKAGGGSYRMVGIPDGLGAFDNRGGTFTVLMNHELPPTTGVTRAHGAAGAFVSKWTIRKRDLSVVAAEDLIRRVATWNTATSSFNAPAQGVTIGRLCSADLPDESAFYDHRSRTGTTSRLFMDGEEVGAEGRAFAHALDGTSWELPHLGKFSWENSVARPRSGEQTVVVGLDDSTPGQVYVYLGEKRRSGSPVEQAGLVGGKLYGIKVAGFPLEPATGIPAGTPFTLEPVGSDGAVQNMTGAAIQTASVADGITEFLRPEDGAWDPRRLNDFYFVTTNAIDRPSRLWRLRFEDPTDPSEGGTITAVLDGTEGQQMLDNMTVDRRGRALLQEDPGSGVPAGQTNYLAKVWLYDIDDDTLTEIAHHDPARFTPGAPAFLTADEESSGIIPAPFLGNGWYLADVQAHFRNADPELVEGGQLLALRVPNDAGDEDDDEDEDNEGEDE
jgi:hypothetical protein